MLFFVLFFERDRHEVSREVRKIWEELGEGKEYDQNIIYENFLII